jgi:hypothetical protein
MFNSDNFLSQAGRNILFYNDTYIHQFEKKYYELSNYIKNMILEFSKEGKKDFVIFIEYYDYNKIEYYEEIEKYFDCLEMHPRMRNRNLVIFDDSLDNQNDECWHFGYPKDNYKSFTEIGFNVTIPYHYLMNWQ